MLKSVTGMVVAMLVFISGGFVDRAAAATDCEFSFISFFGIKLMVLKHDCSTNETIFIPDGYRLIGNYKTITAYDALVGAVIQNGGSKADVKKLRIEGDSLDTTCRTDDERLRGIWFNGASGTIEDNTVVGINKGNGNTCEEGNAIEVSNPPFDGTHPGTRNVTVRYNYVMDFQKGGVVVNGDVYANVYRNKARGLGDSALIPQYGIQMGFGAKGRVTKNTIWNALAPDTVMASGGILLFKAGEEVVVHWNDVKQTDVGIWLDGANRATVSLNKIRYSTYSGIALDDREEPVTDNLVRSNYAAHNDVGIGLFGHDTTSNLVKYNRSEKNTASGICLEFADYNTLFVNSASENPGDGITVKGDFNDIKWNTAKGNSLLDIRNDGDNEYRRNRCHTSSGPPVDCG